MIRSDRLEYVVISDHVQSGTSLTAIIYIACFSHLRLIYRLGLTKQPLTDRARAFVNYCVITCSAACWEDGSRHSISSQCVVGKGREYQGVPALQWVLGNNDNNNNNKTFVERHSAVISRVSYYQT